MGVALARHTVGRPARMADAAPTQAIGAAHGGIKFGNLAQTAHDVDGRTIVNGDARRIVTAVFETLEALDQNILGLQRTREANNSAHISTP